MLLTEEEVKTKDCPFGTLRVLACAATDESPANWEKWVKCNASECMAWRWDDEEFAVRNGEKIRRGFCGLAGRTK